MKQATDRRLSILWLLLLPLCIWAAHFLAAYVVAAVYCAKSNDVDAAIAAVRAINAAITVLALAAIGATTWYGRRHYGRREAGRQPAGSPDQSRFVWSVLLLLSALSALAVIYAGSVAFFFGDCR